MVAAVLETTVLVDILRNHPPAINWFQSQNQSPFAITPIVWMEVISGGQNKIKRRQAARLMKQFEMLYLAQVDMDWAMSRQMIYELSHGIEFTDCLTASISYRLQIPLYAHNLKHFTPILGSLAQKPY